VFIEGTNATSFPCYALPTAALQAAANFGLPILLRTTSDTGRIDSSLDEKIEEDKNTIIFAFKERHTSPPSGRLS
jgi:hypothetical protein